MVHYGPMGGGGGGAGAAVTGMPQSLQLNGLVDPRDLPEPLNYMRSNGAALLVAAVDVVDQQHQQQNQTGKTRNQFYCDQCNMVFGSKSAHTSHMKSHIKYEAASASTSANGMEAEGSTQSNLNGTNGATTGGSGGGDPYQCDKCNKTFAVPARLVSWGLGARKIGRARRKKCYGGESETRRGVEGLLGGEDSVGERVFSFSLSSAAPPTTSFVAGEIRSRGKSFVEIIFIIVGVGTFRIEYELRVRMRVNS